MSIADRDSRGASRPAGLGAGLLGLFLLLALATAWAVSGVVFERGLAARQQTAHQRLALYAASLSGELARYESIPALLATNQRVLKVLRQPRNYSAIQALNEYFEQAAARTGALDIYLMNAEGLTVAASNWQSDHTFIGRNFAFRPYFRTAMQGRAGRYFALGTTSGVRGYYFSYPVMELGHPAGVVVLKMAVERIESAWRKSRDRVLVVDPDDIVFIASEPGWLYHSLGPLTPAVRARLVASARYPGVDFRPLPLRRLASEDGFERVRMQTREGPREYLLDGLEMPSSGWRVLFLQPTREVRREALVAGGMVVAAFLLLSLVVVLWLQGRARRAERIRCDREAREALEKAHAELEQRVALRTADLQREVEDRRRAEEALRTAQDELVQAAKLAVLGQLSASINHELNQPLSAIRSYADNARLLLERGAHAQVAANLVEIRELVDRMARISSQLKLFARRSDERLSRVGLQQALEVSLGLLQADIRGAGVRVETDPAIADVWVQADATRLEQVLVNLIGNALHALENEPAPCIRIELQRHADRRRVDLRVVDNGPGIPEAYLEQIFDPFFTTRKSGLGLGLAISQQIADNMGGRITAANAPQGGAVFVLTLELSGSE